MGLQYRGWGLTAAMGYNIWGGASPLPWATLVEADASGDGEGVGRSGGRCGASRGRRGRWSLDCVVEEESRHCPGRLERYRRWEQEAEGPPVIQRYCYCRRFWNQWQWKKLLTWMGCRAARSAPLIYRICRFIVMSALNGIINLSLM
jgi:hypothetical protein